LSICVLPWLTCVFASLLVFFCIYSTGRQRISAFWHQCRIDIYFD
jgi:hypothetical protein